MKLRFILLFASLLLSSIFANTCAGTVANSAACLGKNDADGLPCCYIQLLPKQAAALTDVCASQATENGCCILGGKTAAKGFVSSTREGEQCVSTAGKIGETTGYCFDWKIQVQTSTTAGVVLGAGTLGDAAKVSGATILATTDQIPTDQLKFDLGAICKHAVSSEGRAFGVLPSKTIGGDALPFHDYRTYATIKTTANGVCSCINREYLYQTGVDLKCFNSYRGATAASYTSAICEAVTDSSGVANQGCCSATFGSSATVAATDCSIGGTAACAGLPAANGHVYCFGRNSVMLLGYTVDSSADIAGYSAAEICFDSNSTTSSAFSGVPPTTGTGAYAVGVTGATSLVASGNVKCTTACVRIKSQSSGGTTTGGTTTTGTTTAVSSGSFFVIGFSFLALFASLLQ